MVRSLAKENVLRTEFLQTIVIYRSGDDKNDATAELRSTLKAWNTQALVFAESEETIRSEPYIEQNDQI